MSANSSANDNGLIVDAALLADIQRQCRQREAELEAARSLTAQSTAPSTFAPPTSPPNSLVGAEEQAQHFSMAADQMPARVRAFFEAEEAIPPWRWESAESRVECERLADLGGWAGG